MMQAINGAQGEWSGASERLRRLPILRAPWTNRCVQNVTEERPCLRLKARRHWQYLWLRGIGKRRAQTESEKRATILIAECQAAARLKVAEAQAQSIKMVTETIKESKVVRLLIFLP